MICKRILSGYFESDSETSESAYFSENQLPQLATEKIQQNKLTCVLLHMVIQIGKPSLIKKND
ncbi:hypothetical protein AF68_09380 [Streptococcus uberis B362]|nr:hypothetical protein AF68_09380 [Streptococcus uberis B362]